jgi:hypothetical protein
MTSKLATVVTPASVSGSPGQAPDSERRGAPRFDTTLETACQLPAAGRVEQWPARVDNLSATGIGLVLGRRFEPGTLLSFLLYNKTHECTHSFLARVVHATRQEGKNWLLGCRLVGEIGDEDLRALGGGRVQSEEEDPRAWVRFNCEIEAACQQLNGEPGQPWSVTIVDISTGGMKLYCPTAQEPGTLLGVTLPAKPLVNFRVRVLRATRDGDGWYLGCAFIDSISAEELASFQ